MLSIVFRVTYLRRPPARRRDESGETLVILILWPTLIVAILLLLVHTFIVVNAGAEAEVAASAGLRAAWRSAANADFLTDPVGRGPYTDVNVAHPATAEMAAAAQDAVARAAATRTGWRWWSPGAAVVQSNWCTTGSGSIDRPGERGDPGWVRVVVSGEVFGPLAALWPNRLDRVYAAALGPAVLSATPQAGLVDLGEPPSAAAQWEAWTC